MSGGGASLGGGADLGTIGGDLPLSAGTATPTDWDKIGKLLGAGGKILGSGGSTSDANYLRIRSQDAPVEGGSPSAANLLLTLLQMHRNAVLSQAQQQPRASLLG